MLQGLSITGLGMGLVFLMIIALWGIMVLLVLITNRPEKLVETEEPEEQESTVSVGHAAQAAAAAVAYALLAQKQLRTRAAKAKTSPAQSQWLLSGRVRQTLHQPGKGQKK